MLRKSGHIWKKKKVQVWCFPSGAFGWLFVMIWAMEICNTCKSVGVCIGQVNLLGTQNFGFGPEK